MHLPHVTALLFSVKEVFGYPKDKLGGGECGDPETSMEYERRKRPTSTCLCERRVTGAAEDLTASRHDLTIRLAAGRKVKGSAGVTSPLQIPSERVRGSVVCRVNGHLWDPLLEARQLEEEITACLGFVRSVYRVCSFSFLSPLHAPCALSGRVCPLRRCRAAVGEQFEERGEPNPRDGRFMNQR
ncbi:uncharacterized protein LOC132157976 isoform X2 [Carassius carassius]|uniref:uncharacterized protein LOC132157976 isoform X2 n=1 Tax=Carassius carassius TaxID=217509 RepID=UPI0028684AEB|nr:uncharacterized protein LOC132157976 isoform X2 [Carassius carassius]